MIGIGQIIYNLEDYHNTGGVLFTSQEDFKTTLIERVQVQEDGTVKTYFVTDNGVETDQDKINIYDRNIIRYSVRQPSDPEGAKLPGPAYEKIYKLGIQAPAGTIFYLTTAPTPSADSYKRIMMGRSGIYELDESVEITGLYFERPYKYDIDTEATQQSIEAGVNLMNNAKNYFQTAVRGIGNSNIIKWLNGAETIDEDTAILFETAVKALIGADNWDNFVNIAKNIDLAAIEVSGKAAEKASVLVISANDTSTPGAINPNPENPDDPDSAGNFPIDAFVPGIGDYLDSLSYDSSDVTEDDGILYDTDYWEVYGMLHDGYLDMYDEGFSIYQKGLNGIYKQGNAYDVKNLIIDYLYETYYTENSSKGGIN